jgi:hypothetical protein
VRRRIVTWLRGWQYEWFVLDFSLITQEVRGRLAAGLASRSASAVYAHEHGFDLSDVVVGRLRGDTFRIRLSRIGGRNSWRPFLRGRLEPTPTGCQVVCRIGWHPLTLTITIAWFALLAVSVVVNLLYAARDLVTGRASAATGPLGTLAVCAGAALFIAVLVTVGSWQGRPEASFLRGWLAEHLHPDT